MVKKTDSSLPFSEAGRAWFTDNFKQPTEVQALGWPLIASGNNGFLLAPTGSGKTLAAFLWSLDHLQSTPELLANVASKLCMSLHLKPSFTTWNATFAHRWLVSSGPERDLVLRVEVSKSISAPAIPLKRNARECCARRVIFSSQPLRVST